ncbi:MAG: hypothetical protein K8R36_00325 [Planctomycetales bacterium]|nr:hypothetical protein [Planctomycetales bacterium]
MGTYAKEAKEAYDAKEEATIHSYGSDTTNRKEVIRPFGKSLRFQEVHDSNRRYS